MKNTNKLDCDSTFAKKLTSLLEDKSVSMTKLAKELGVKQQTVSQWAEGSTTPALKHLKPLASYFEVSIDELVTGVAPDNEEIHLDTGLSNKAIEILKRLNIDDKDNDISDGNKANEKINNKIIIEFLNLIIETMDSKFYSLSRLARLCMEYMVGAHEPLLEQEDLIRETVDGYEHLVHVDSPDFQNEILDYKTYQLTKRFEYLITDLAKKPKISERVKKIYVKGNLDLPDYSDSRFKPDAIFNESVSEKYPLKMRYTEPSSSKETSDSEDDATNTQLD